MSTFSPLEDFEQRLGYINILDSFVELLARDGGVCGFAADNLSSFFQH